MLFEFHHNPREFRERALPLLLRNEAESCVIFGVLSRLIDSGFIPPEGLAPLMMTVVAADGQCLAVATITLQYPVVLTAASPAAAAAMAAGLHEARITVRGVVGATGTSEAFARAWAGLTGSSWRCDTRLGLYQSDQVIAPPFVPGSFRGAEETDFDLLLGFAECFYRKIREPTPTPREPLTRAINERRLHVWCDDTGRIVSMAAWAGPTPNGVRVNFVYTPPELRGRGFASNCVATLTRQLLASGRKSVFLFTDMANPVSNRIYQRIGYRHIADQQKILFNPAEAK